MDRLGWGGELGFCLCCWIVAAMVSLLVATKADPASIGPASALLSLIPSWTRGPDVDHNPTYKTGNVRMLQLSDHIVHYDLLEQRWESQTGERVSEIIFMSRHTAVSNRPALTVHPIGIPHLLPQVRSLSLLFHDSLQRKTSCLVWIKCSYSLSLMFMLINAEELLIPLKVR